MEIFRDRLFPAGSAYRQAAVPTKKEADPGTGSSFRTEEIHAEQAAEPAERPAVESAPAVTEEKPCSPPLPTKKPKLGKKTIAAIAAVLLVVALGVFYASTHGTTEDGFVYALKSGDYAIITDYKGEGGDITIPEEIKDLRVEGIEADAFTDCENITSVTVQADVYCWDGFSGCDSVALVAFEEGVLDPSWESQLPELKGLRCVRFSAPQQINQLTGDRTDLFDESVVLCYLGQDTGYGRIQSVEIKGGIVYAFTDTDNAVLLGLPENVDVTALPSALGSRQVILPDGRLAGRNAYYTEDENGYVYLVDEDAGCVTITGYKGSEDIPVMDDYFAGYPITKIGKNAFAGNETITTAGFPMELVEVQSGAFRNCTNLGTLALFGEVSFAADAFVGCGKLRCAMVPAGVSVDTSVLPQNFKVYDYGMETGAGKLTFPHVADDGTVYGLTENDRVAVLDIAGGAVIAESVMDCPVTWVHKDAVSGVSSAAQITVPGSVFVASEICDAVQWKVADIHSDAWAWIWSNKICARVNSALGTAVASVDGSLVNAMQIRAKELSQSDSHTRPNGKSWSTALDECKVDWDFGYVSKRAYTGKCTDIPEEYLDELQKMYAVQEVESNNRYYNYIAVSAYYNAETNTTHISCCAVIR